jgi:hypothetical protein
VHLLVRFGRGIAQAWSDEESRAALLAAVSASRQVTKAAADNRCAGSIRWLVNFHAVNCVDGISRLPALCIQCWNRREQRQRSLTASQNRRTDQVRKSRNHLDNRQVLLPRGRSMRTVQALTVFDFFVSFVSFWSEKSQQPPVVRPFLRRQSRNVAGSGRPTGLGTRQEPGGMSYPMTRASFAGHARHAASRPLFSKRQAAGAARRSFLADLDASSSVKR